MLKIVKERRNDALSNNSEFYRNAFRSGGFKMTHSNNSSIVSLRHFIQATRDSGYKGTATALAELIDNAYEAGATRVDISVARPEGDQFTVVIIDDGRGMPPAVLQTALQFGGSSRFNSRGGTGRYGMGLPNSSISLARRVDVYTWTQPGAVWWSFLDVDEIVAGRMRRIPKPQRIEPNTMPAIKQSDTGTVIMWSKCDRLDYKSERKLASKLKHSLGRFFRYHLWGGRKLCINGEPVQTVDPLFLREGASPIGAETYGPPLKFEINLPKQDGGRYNSTITVVFTELPISEWHAYSIETKRSIGISKGAGVSIVRADREIDDGWLLMGGKRKENYDDWWRCELRFSPELDELFGVTNTKQGIHPTETLKAILTPDLERIAHVLNRRVREKFLRIKSGNHASAGELRAEDRDHLLEPPARIFHTTDNFSDYGLSQLPRGKRDKKRAVSGLAYRIEHKALEEGSFFIPLISRFELVVLLNEEHPFYERMYVPITKSTSHDAKVMSRYLELLLFAAARAECSLWDAGKQDLAQSLREAWSKTLATFLE